MVGFVADNDGSEGLKAVLSPPSHRPFGPWLAILGALDTTFDNLPMGLVLAPLSFLRAYPWPIDGDYGSGSAMADVQATARHGGRPWGP